VEAGHDLKLVCRDLGRVVRDIMILAVDPARAGDGELADGELERLKQVGARFSREDVLRAFDVLAKAEFDMRNAAHPRYHFEMALLRWMHLRKLVPLADVLEQFGGGGGAGGGNTRAASTPSVTRPQIAPRPAPPVSRPVAPPPAKRVAPVASAPPATAAAAVGGGQTTAPSGGVPSAGLKDALLAEIRAGKSFFYNTVVAQAQSIDVSEERVAFTFSHVHRMLRERFEETRPWIEAAAERLAGRKVPVLSLQAEGGASTAPAVAAEPTLKPTSAPAGRDDLKAEALATPTVQAVLDVFPAEIKDVEEI
jgi:DNA polymerase-3 subunit gamma/tau